MRIIGAADEFWRLRVMRVDTTEGLDFEWHDDILYREPEPDMGVEVEEWYVEAVSVGDDEVVVRLADFGDRGEAEEFRATAAEDLAGMTKIQFEEAYLELAEEREAKDRALPVADDSKLD
jgi:hypothetical protein